LAKKYFDNNEESQLDKSFAGKFGKNASNMVRRMVETNAFGD
jgi:hypothetical protein